MKASCLLALLAVLLFATATLPGGKGSMSFYNNYNYVIEVKDESFKTANSRKFILHLYNPMAAGTTTVKIGSDSSCETEVSGLPALSTFSSTLVLEKSTSSSADTIYVCVSGTAPSVANTGKYLAYYGHIINTTNGLDDSMDFAVDSDLMKSEGSIHFQLAARLCKKVMKDGKAIVPLQLHNFETDGTALMGLNIASSSAGGDYIKIFEDSYATVTISASSAHMPISENDASNMNLTLYNFSDVVEKVNSTTVDLEIPVPDYIREDAIFFITFRFTDNCGWFSCPNPMNFSLKPTLDTVLDSTRYTTEEFGTTLSSLDEKFEVQFHGIPYCPFVFKNNFKYTHSDGVTPAPKRYFLWTDKTSNFPSAREALSMYAMHTSSKVSDFGDLQYLPSYANYLESGVSKYNTDEAGYATARTSDTIVVGLDAPLGWKTPLLPTSSFYKVIMRSMVGYIFTSSTIVNRSYNYSAWHEYGFSLAESFLIRLDSKSTGVQQCFTIQCDSSDADCSPILVYQRAIDEKNSISNVGFFSSGEGVKASTFCVEKGVTQTSEYAFILPMNASTRKWLNISTPLTLHLDEVPVHTETTVTGFTTEKKRASSLDMNFVRVEVSQELLDAITEDKQLTFSVTPINIHDEPIMLPGWKFNVSASQLCPRAGATCTSIVSTTSSNKQAIAGGSLIKDAATYKSLYIRTEILETPDNYSDDVYLQIKGTVEDKDQDIIVVDDDDADKNTDNNDLIDDIPDNDNGKEEEIIPEDKPQDTNTDGDNISPLQKKLGPLKVLYWIIIGAATIILLIVYIVMMKHKARKSAGQNKFWSVVDAGETQLP